jgi:hypothetical protein
MGWTYDAGRIVKEERFADIVLLLPDGAYGSGGNGMGERVKRWEVRKRIELERDKLL